MVIKITMIVATYMNAVSPLLMLGGFGASAELASAAGARPLHRLPRRARERRLSSAPPP
jgi:hypothetical protein